MSYLQKLQQTETEILEEIDRLCEKHSIVYYLAGGTLLGAVRHRGFIPWDDDIDVAMPRFYFERFRDICLSELDVRFFLLCPQSDQNYW
ncbi:MAG: LicD family protein, partial [Clostridiales bacterium]|nr:LicD family protein [Clostridiales bacterium]